MNLFSFLISFKLRVTHFREYLEILNQKVTKLLQPIVRLIDKNHVSFFLTINSYLNFIYLKQ